MDNMLPSLAPTRYIADTPLARHVPTLPDAPHAAAVGAADRRDPHEAPARRAGHEDSRG